MNVLRAVVTPYNLCHTDHRGILHQGHGYWCFILARHDDCILRESVNEHERILVAEFVEPKLQDICVCDCARMTGRKSPDESVLVFPYEHVQNGVLSVSFRLWSAIRGQHWRLDIPIVHICGCGLWRT